ncbi:MAG: sugar phosphate isomerase/epimerase [Planctomycetes bacterium]|nr:sugar phosphate isomerase/epimerase [Planctomycetota bacterium]
MMKIGFYTYQYVDIADLPIVEVMEAIAKEGYDGIDISATRGRAQDPSLFPQEDRRRYRETAERLGLEIEAVVTHLPMLESVWNGDPINLPGAVDLAVDVGARIVTVHIGSFKETEHPFDLAWESAVEHLADACRYAGSRGILIALDAIWPTTLLDTPEKVSALIRQVGSPSLKHNYDPCYLAIAGIDPAQAVKELAQNICHAHVKDYRGSYPHFQHHIPGEGKLNFKGWTAALKRIHYPGYLTVECFRQHDLKKACRVAYRTLSKLVS